MEPRPAHTFDGFRLEPPPGGLWRGDVRMALRPRSLAQGSPRSVSPLVVAGSIPRGMVWLPNGIRRILTLHPTGR
jgi:hypothetical protein